MEQCTDSHSEATSSTQLVNPAGCPVMAAAPSMHILTQNDQFRFLMCNHSKTWIVLQLWCWLATKVHIACMSSCTFSQKTYHTKTGIVALLSTLADSSTQIVNHGDSLTLSKDCASVPSAISWVHLVLVLAKPGTHTTFWTAASPKRSRQVSLEQAGSTLPP